MGLEPAIFKLPAQMVSTPQHPLNPNRSD